MTQYADASFLVSLLNPRESQYGAALNYYRGNKAKARAYNVQTRGDGRLLNPSLPGAAIGSRGPKLQKPSSKFQAPKSSKDQRPSASPNSPVGDAARRAGCD